MISQCKHHTFRNITLSAFTWDNKCTFEETWKCYDSKRNAHKFVFKISPTISLCSKIAAHWHRSSLFYLLPTSDTSQLFTFQLHICQTLTLEKFWMIITAPFINSISNVMYSEMSFADSEIVLINLSSNISCRAMRNIELKRCAS